MATLRPSSLSIEGFRSFEDRSVINFPERGLVLISTRNKVSSGVGKSSIPAALAFDLGFCDIPATRLVPWGSKAKPKIGLTLTDGTNKYEIFRNPKLGIITNGVPYVSMTSGAEEELARILKSPIELVEALTYKKQRAKTNFLTMTDSDKKDFLTQVLGLQQLEAGEAIADAKLKSLTLNETNLAAQVEAAQRTITILEPQIVGESDARAAYEAAQQRYNALGVGSEASQALEQRALTIRGEISRTSAIIQQAVAASSQNESIKLEVPRISQEIGTIRDNKCPKCTQKWESGQNEIARLQERAESLMATFRKNVVVIDSAAPLSAAMPQLQAELENIQRQLGQLSAPRATAVAEVNATRSRYEQIVRSSQALAAERTRLDQKMTELAAVRKEIEIETHVSALLSRTGFLSVIFDEVLTEIQNKANDMISRLPNIATMVLSIKSSSVAKGNGAVKKAITTKIIKSGSEISLGDLSGGQQCAMELCADLATRMVIRRRAGSPIGWMILDESMDGLCTAIKKSALEMIQELVEGLVIVIDHSTEIKESFNAVINVGYDGRKSWIEQQA